MSAPLILYIEDNIEGSELVKRVLEIEGFEIMAAYDGREGLELVAHRIPDLILMDINLPEMDGYEASYKNASVSCASEYANRCTDSQYYAQ